MGFFKSLFGGDKPTPAPVVKKEMQGTEHPLMKLALMESFLEGDMANPNRNSQYPWTLDKQSEFFAQFSNEKLIFDGEIGSMGVGIFNVDRNLEGHVWASLYKETKSEIVAYNQARGEDPPMVGLLHLEFTRGKPRIYVIKQNAAPGTPDTWSNQHWKDK